MNAPVKSFHERKLEHIMRDYDKSFSAVLKLRDYGNSVRQWNIAVIVAYLGLAKACIDKGTGISVLPLLGAIYVFWIMEAFVKASADFYRMDRLEKVDQLFSKEDDDSFKQLIKQYQFANSPKKSDFKKWCVKGGRVHRLSRGLVNCQTFVFYMLPLAILIAWYYPPSIGFCLCLPGLFFLAARSSCWYRHDRTSGAGTSSIS